MGSFYELQLELLSAKTTLKASVEGINTLVAIDRLVLEAERSANPIAVGARYNVDAVEHRQFILDL